jgi:[phosphatase 2A protein]-leucine-carboxy methyltransferase
MYRMSRLELLDETEELDLVLAHYAISWGLLLPASDSHGDWGRWGLTQRVNT